MNSFFLTLEIAAELDSLLRAAFFGFDDFDFSKYQPCEAAEKQFHDQIIRAIH
jgi:hypothetical protein